MELFGTEFGTEKALIDGKSDKIWNSYGMVYRCVNAVKHDKNRLYWCFSENYSIGLVAKITRSIGV